MQLSVTSCAISNKTWDFFKKNRASVEVGVCSVYFSILNQEAIWTVNWLDGVYKKKKKDWEGGVGWVIIFRERSEVMAFRQHMSKPGSHTSHLLNAVCGVLSAICSHRAQQLTTWWIWCKTDHRKQFAALLSSDAASLTCFMSWLLLKENFRTAQSSVVAAPNLHRPPLSLHEEGV